MGARGSERAKSGRGSRRRRVALGGFVAFALLAAGCEQGGARPRHSAPSTQVEGLVVARVNGEAITAAEVERVVQLTGLTPREAVERLVGERLLVQHAEARGYGELAVVRRELERARVRALLQEVIERGRAPEDIPLEKVRARFEQKRAALEASGPTTFEEHEPKLRAELAQEARKEALKALLKELRARVAVSYDEDAIDKALSSENAAQALGS
jgi:hypothetical protein